MESNNENINDVNLELSLGSMFLALAVELSTIRAKVDVTFGMLEKVLSEYSDQSLEEIQNENDRKIDNYSDRHLQMILDIAIEDEEQKEIFRDYMESRNEKNDEK